MALLEEFSRWLVEFVHGWGYFGIFVMTFLESTFVPIPAELTMIPAGYLAYQGHMNGVLVLLIAILGSICGSVFSYYIAFHYGRKFLFHYGKYFFFTAERMEKLDKFFAAHGEISTLTGRLVPGLRHFISFPAGLGHMDMKKFVTYTAVGAGIWMAILIVVGYVIGGNSALIKHWTPYITISALVAVFVMIVFYVQRHKRKQRKLSDGQP